MAYVKNNWVDREGTTRYFETVDSDGAKIFTPDYTQVTELGTPVNSDNMNHIEEGIAAGSFTKYDTKATYVLNDLVTVIEDASPVIYKSLQNNNIGKALSNSAYWEKISLGGGGGGLEIGDIGFTQMAIDETKGKRRILNGQLIIQEQYVQFTNIIKNSVALNPDLACTEAEWQTAVTMSTNGVCYKFVIDDNAGTIRLPKYPQYFIGGLAGKAPVVGNGMTLGLTNGTVNGALTSGSDNHYFSIKSLYYGVSPQTGATPDNGIYSSTFGVTTDSTKSGIEAHLSNNQTEQIKGTYFIQVATGAETEDNIINEIELNNPFSLLDYKYSEYELNNISWLRSNGQWNSKAVYPAVYDLLLKIYNGAETKTGVSVKLHTEEYTDEDFVINQDDETFRLQLKVKLVGCGSVPVMSISDVSALNGQAGFIGSTISSNNGVLKPAPNGVVASTNGTFILEVDLSKATNTDLYLYFYVGETVQNANLINAGRIEEKLVDKVDKSSLVKVPCIIETYVNGTSGYVVWSNGLCWQWGQASTSPVVFLKPYKTTPNIQLVQHSDAAGPNNNPTIRAISLDQFAYYSERNIIWQAIGYIA